MPIARSLTVHRRLRLEQVVAELGASLLSAPATRTRPIVEHALDDLLQCLGIDSARLGDCCAGRIRTLADAGAGTRLRAPWPRWLGLDEVGASTLVAGRCAPGRPVGSGDLPVRAAAELPIAYLLIASRLADSRIALLSLGAGHAVCWPEEVVPRLQLLARVALTGLYGHNRRAAKAVAHRMLPANRRRNREAAALRMIRFPTLGVESIGTTSSSRRPSLRWVMGSSKPIL